MTPQEFDTTRWRKGMKARTVLRTLTQGELTIEATVTGINFLTGGITLQHDKFGVCHRHYEDMELIDDGK